MQSHISRATVNAVAARVLLAHLLTPRWALNGNLVLAVCVLIFPIKIEMLNKGSQRFLRLCMKTKLCSDATSNSYSIQLHSNHESSDRRWCTFRFLAKSSTMLLPVSESLFTFKMEYFKSHSQLKRLLTLSDFAFFISLAFVFIGYKSNCYCL